MWQKYYRDYRDNSGNRKEKVEPSRGIIGCEMHEAFGWGPSPPKRKRRRGLIASLIIALFGEGEE